MTTAPCWPAFYMDGPNVTVVRGLEDVPIALDPVLVDQQVVVIDAVGHRLRPIVSRPERRRLLFLRYSVGPEIVGLEVQDDEDRSQLLRDSLADCLLGHGVSTEPGESLEALVRRAASLID